MKRVVPMILTVVLILAFLINSSVRTQANGAIYVSSYTATCSRFTVTFVTNGSGANVEMKVTLNPNDARYDLYDNFYRFMVTGTASVTTVTGNFPLQPAGTRLNLLVNDGELLDVWIACSSTGVTWFNPGDGRLDPLPGDRIAVYCNPNANPPSLSVLPIDDQGNGIKPAVSFTASNLDKNGNATRILPNNMGTISVNENNGKWFVAWNGGLYNATGNDIFMKNSLACKI
jgi:hypothetical protein